MEEEEEGKEGRRWGGGRRNFSLILAIKSVFAFYSLVFYFSLGTEDF